MGAKWQEAMGLKIELTSDWRIGASAAASPDIDAEPVTTAEGLPMIPGRALRGLLRDALERYASFHTEPAEAARVQAVTAWCFGSSIGARADTTEDDGGNTDDKAEVALDSLRLATVQGHLRVDSAEPGSGDARTALRAWAADGHNSVALGYAFRRVASTSIETDTGVAKDGGLRAVRVCTPITLYAALRPTSDGAAPPNSDWRSVVEEALPFVHELGSQRTRGFGRVKMQACPDPQPVSHRSPAQLPANATSAWLRIDLVDDVVVRQTTDAGFDVGNGIPGSTLLGAAARLLYDELGSDAFEAFHSGAVRFGDAMPAADGEPAWPLPRALHREKGVADGPCVPFVRGKRPTTGQWEPMTGALLLGTLRKHQLEVRTSLRTSISERGTARSGLLYSLVALARGQSLLSRLEAEDPALLARVVEALDGRRVHLGRSKGAEFGTCTLTLQRDDHVPATIPSTSPSATAEELVVWCLSDLCLIGSLGEARLTPMPEDFGLPCDWSLDEEHSHLRTRRYSPFHGKRGRPAMEREVVTAGSVLVFRRAPNGKPLEQERVEAETMGGVGVYRAEGLGRVCLNPKLLDEPDVRIDAPIEDGAQPSVEVAADSALDAVHFVAEWSKLAAVATTRDRLYRAAVDTADVLSAYGLPSAQLGALRAFANERSGQKYEDFKSDFVAQFSAESATEDVDRAPEPARRLSREEDNRRRVRDQARRQAGSSGAIQKERWQVKRSGKSAFQVLEHLLQDENLGDELARPGAAAMLIELIGARARGRSQGGNR